jgi:hypothetical protein
MGGQILTPRELCGVLTPRQLHVTPRELQPREAKRARLVPPAVTLSWMDLNAPATGGVRCTIVHDPCSARKPPQARSPLTRAHKQASLPCLDVLAPQSGLADFPIRTECHSIRGKVGPLLICPWSLA